MLERIENILKELNIELAYQEYNGEANEYIIFDIFNEKDIEYADDINLGTNYYITINYWHKSLSKVNMPKLIKELMKKHGFFFDGMKSLPKYKGFHGKNLDFIYEEETNGCS